MHAMMPWESSERVKPTARAINISASNTMDVNETAIAFDGIPEPDLTDFPFVTDPLVVHRPLGLLDLPFEIWTEICQLVISEQDTIVVSNGPKDWIFGTGISNPSFVAKAVEQPPIIRTCYAIRSELLLTWYHQTEFRFVDIYFGMQGFRGWVLAMREAGLWQHVRRCVLVTEQECDDILRRVEYYVFGGLGVQVALIKDGHGEQTVQRLKVPYLVKTKEMRE